MSNINSFQDLRSWQKAHKLVLKIYNKTDTLPSEEKYVLTSQIRRAAVSIPANIAEGMGRNSLKELIRFLYIARGSAEELKSLLLIVKDLKLLKMEVMEELLDEITTIGKSINAHIRSLSKAK